MRKMWQKLWTHDRAVHRSDRSYHCDVRGKSFKASFAVLKHHKEIHENKRSYKCKICGKGLNSSGSLVHHRKMHESKV